MDKPEILTTLGKQDTGRRQTKHKKQHNTTHTKMSDTEPIKTGGESRDSRRGTCLLYKYKYFYFQLRSPFVQNN
jgi:hypothetical protein